MEERTQKPHIKKKAGKKVERKKENKFSNAKKSSNPKAFTFQSSGKAEKTVRRNQDIGEKKLHVPLVDRTPLESPPVVIAVVGPPGTGKSTLIRSLVKRYTKHNLNDIKGPITVVSGKKRRLTFMECNNDMNSMIDVAKVADLVLLMIDASFGFEMETFEFLNILQSHGFPKVMGVLTHLDKFRNNKTLKTTKKRLKNRFWTEIYQGAKLFYLSGIINGRYPNMEIQNLSRFISVMKFRPLIWRNNHPYVVADRIEDLTDPELLHRKPHCDRTVTLYGYLRGTNLKSNMRVHIPGAGDHFLADVSVLPDPCPLPDKERKRLDEKHKLIYAPMSDVGGVMYDKDAVYINVPGHFTKKSAYAPSEPKENGEDEEEEEEEQVIPHGTGEKLVMNLQDAQDTLASQLEESELRIFSGSAPVKAADVKESLEQDESGRTRRRAVFGTEDEDMEEDEDDDDDDEDMMDVGEDDDEDMDEDAPRRGKALSKFDTRNIPKKGEKDDKEDQENEPSFEFADSDSDLGQGDEDEDMVMVDGRRKTADDDDQDLAGELRWKANLQEKASEMFSNHRRTNLMSLIYNNLDLSPEDILNGNYDNDTEEKEDAEDAEEEEFFQLKRENTTASAEVMDSSRDPIDYEELEEWDDEETLDSIRNRFITGDIDAANGQSAFPPEEDEVEGDFEDLEADSEQEGEGEEGKSKKKDKEGMIRDPMMVERERIAKRKEELRKKFTEEFGDDDEGPKMDFYEQKKAEIQQQLEVNRLEFENDDPQTRAMVEGYRPGSYVRLLIKNMPCEFVENFDPTYPILVGGLLPTEDQFGWVQVRIKRHRWHPKILKTNDPLIFSIGWRRFQSIPIYSLNDGTRNRMLKYTPEHMHCLATFYGPVHTPNTGFCAVQNVSDSRNSTFRISATGAVVDISQSAEIVKKLKLTGYPTKVYRNTAFIRDMFTSSLEVAKFEGANIRTVSGIRGQVKKALPKPEGHFRATFEDKILMSDIVFLRAWYPVKPRKFYNPVTSLLLSSKQSWQGMRTTGQIRKELNMHAPQKVDSIYKPIERKERRFNALKVPKSLQAELPFANKPKNATKSKKQSYLNKRAVVLEPEEKKIVTLMQQLNTLRNEKDRKRKFKDSERREANEKKKAKIAEKTEVKTKERRKDYFRKEQQKASRTASSAH
ncbi:Glycoside hydrolase 2 (Mannanase, beta-galactosidase) [Rhizopus stolonifer]|uniref:Glycoside hydrolase 2 (Mannanase, beta-galactosidase) n=1 Tax=Rhizopus stolonifer TaxID=4846 RepID=A0A367JYF8_RHIST|nr:Glycoside hydrolase 2 (Mannanase, beta-galactosidase) [Rhizopus stolonifer]